VDENVSIFLQKNRQKEKSTHKEITSKTITNESRNLNLYSNWQSPAVFAEFMRHMYTLINIKKNEERKEKLVLLIYVCEHEKNNEVLCPLSKIVIYIYTYKLLFDIAYGRSSSRMYSVFIIKMFGRMALCKRERKSLLKGILFVLSFFFSLSRQQ
jgi:hypothetical protein